MQLKLLATACAFALTAGVAHAEPTVTGYLGAAYDRINLDVGGGDADADVWSVKGAVASALTSSVGGQIDFDWSNYSVDDVDGDLNVYTPTVHLFYNADFGRVGGFAGVAHNDDGDFWGLGAEGQFNVDPKWTLYGAVGYGQLDADGADGNLDVWSVRAEARYFLTENTRLEGFGTWSNLDGDGESTDVWTLGAGAEYQFASAPFSVFGRYEHTKMNDFDVDADAFKIGLRWNFGGTLLQRDRSGASLPGFGDIYGGSAVQGVAGAATALVGGGISEDEL